MLFLTTLLIALIINAVLFLFAFYYQSDKLTDFAYSLSFISIVLINLAVAQNRSGLLALVASLVLIWALRLGIFLVVRIKKYGVDKRFDSIRHSFFKFLQFWLGQAVVAWVLLLPVIFLTDRNPKVDILTFVGVLIWIVGFLAESTADLQKYRFKQRKGTENKWIDEGLWHYSRHPNYFGEILIWVGIYVTLYTSLSGLERVIGLVSPLAISITLIFISGIPLLEKSADLRWGNNKQYQTYKQRTSILIPLWRKR